MKEIHPSNLYVIHGQNGQFVERDIVALVRLPSLTVTAQLVPEEFL